MVFLLVCTAAVLWCFCWSALQQCCGVSTGLHCSRVVFLEFPLYIFCFLGACCFCCSKMSLLNKCQISEFRIEDSVWLWTCQGRLCGPIEHSASLRVHIDFQVLLCLLISLCLSGFLLVDSLPRRPGACAGGASAFSPREGVLKHTGSASPPCMNRYLSPPHP